VENKSKNQVSEQLQPAKIETRSVAKNNPEPPIPVIGEEAYQGYLKKNIRHSVVSDCTRNSGIVVVRFYVDKNGRPDDISVFRSLCRVADKEAIRLVSEGPNWTIGKKQVILEISF
jgi:outer membrane biosynthesis protein TonB